MNLFVLCVKLFFVAGAESAVRKWMASTRVLDKANWEAENPGCRGMYFAASSDPKIYLSSITISKIALPLDGQIALEEGTKIVFDSTNKTCINLKQFKYDAGLDPRNWDPLPNKAIVDVERIPCQYDDIILPKINSFAMYIEDIFQIKSLTIDGEKLNSDAWRSLLKRDDINVFRDQSTYGMNLMSSSCSNSKRCKCQESPYTLARVCEHVRAYRNDSEECHQPVQPFGHCTKICGALLTLLPDDDFDLKEFEDSLRQYDNVEYHVTKTLPSADSHKLQLVIVDKGKYAERSIKVGKILEKLLKEKSFRASLTLAQYAGKTNVSMSEILSVTFGIMFGALFAVLAFFTVIYFHYVGSAKDLPFRIPRGSGLRPFLFARFENNEDGGLSFERTPACADETQRSFDNPMFGIPSTSQSQVDLQPNGAIEEGEENVIGPSQNLENFEEMQIENL